MHAVRSSTGADHRNRQGDRETGRQGEQKLRPRNRWQFRLALLLVSLSPCLLVCSLARGESLPEEIAKLGEPILATNKEKTAELADMLDRDARSRRIAANQRETKAWQDIKTVGDWEAYRDDRLKKLEASLGQFPTPVKDLHPRTTGTIHGDGYTIENVVFESRPGLYVTANVYSPAKPAKSMPGLLIIHSHHNPKTQSELRDMGILWARLGCVVMVPDQLGHGERRQHPFKTASDYEGSFGVGRQDYYFRYNTSLQLYLIGDSLMGWMAWDNRRCVDYLLTRPGVDGDRIVLLGSVAGGGDPCAVTAALDRRIKAAAPFNFGGPQPETKFPLPEDAESRFNYAGGGSWESTRNLRLSARDGFMPWVIVASVAPRGLVYGHEFAWDREHDPVWARLEKIWGFYDKKDLLTATTGRGAVTGKPPEATHCNNIGPVHRKGFYPAFKKWFDIPEPAEENRIQQRPEDLLCLTSKVLAEIRPKTLSELATEIGRERLEKRRSERAHLSQEEQRKQLRADWSRLLGDIEPRTAKRTQSESKKISDISIERDVLEVEPGITVPFVLLVPAGKKDGKPPVVIAVSQQGKQAFLKERATEIESLLKDGYAVCLPDVRGTGETRPSGGSRGRRSDDTAISAEELMVGQTLLGSRLRDLRTVIGSLKKNEEIDGGRIVLWGDSFAPVNEKDRKLAVPLDAEKFPDQAEPLGALLALFGALYEDDVKAVRIRRGLVSYESVLRSQFMYVPHDVIVPGAMTVADVSDIAMSLAPRPIWVRDMVDGQNRAVPTDDLAKTWENVRGAYKQAGAEGSLYLDREPKAGWIK